MKQSENKYSNLKYHILQALIIILIFNYTVIYGLNILHPRLSISMSMVLFRSFLALYLSRALFWSQSNLRHSFSLSTLLPSEMIFLVEMLLLQYEINSKLKGYLKLLIVLVLIKGRSNINFLFFIFVPIYNFFPIFPWQHFS